MKKTILIIFAIAMTILNANAQTPQTCDCQVDTLGLAAYLSILNLNDNSPLSFEVENENATFAVLHGYINGSTPTVVENFIENYPNVTTLVFMQMPGSDDDSANIIASQLLKEQDYIFYLPAVFAYPQDAYIASGAVDMFFAGNRRVIDETAEVGVHSWSDGFNEATDYPVGHEYHLFYIDYYVEMGLTQELAEDFYYFTIESAPANGIHWMTEAEIEAYQLRTCIFNTMPLETYTVSMNGSTLIADVEGLEYQWVNCNDINVPIVGATNQSFTPTENGSYAVYVIDGGCTSLSDCQLVLNVGIEEQYADLIKVFPNPAEQNFYVQLNQTKGTINISTLDGRLVEKITTDGSEVFELYRNYHSGIYIVSIETAKGVQRTKLVVK